MMSLKQPKTNPHLRVAHTADTPRGATWMAEQLRELKSYGHTVEAIIPAEGELSRKLQSWEVPYRFHQFGFPWMISHTYDCLRNILGLVALFHRRRYQVVHHHLYPSMVVSRLAAWIADVPVRLSMIPGPFYIDAMIPSSVEMACCWMDTHTIVSCQYSGQRYRERGVPDHHLELVYYGADEHVFNPDRIDRWQARHQLLNELGLDESAKLVGMVAYFYPPLSESDHYPESVWGKSIKGHETLLSCIPAVLAAHPEARFLLIGDGWGDEGIALMENLRRETQERELGDQVCFLGHRSDVPQILAALDVSLQLSRSENLGGTIESLLMGKAMIATRVGGMVDSVRHEETGMLVEVDDPAGLASAIVTMLSEPDFAGRLGDAGRRLMLDQFTLQETARRLDSIYQVSYKALNHRGYRLHVSLFRALAAIPVFAFIMAQQFKYELKSLYGERFAQEYNPIAVIQDSLCEAARPLYERNGHEAFKVITFAKRLFPSLRFWLVHVHKQTKLKLDWLDSAKMHLSNFSRTYSLSLNFRVRRIRELMFALARNLKVRMKRVFDMAVAAQLLFLFSPVMAIALWKVSRTRHSAFETHIVLGRENARLEILTLAGDKNSTGLIALFYWLPLLFSVLKGDLSIVGPRIRPQFIPEDGEENLPRSWRLKPGLTGWCQLNMTDKLDFSTLNRLDILYMVNWSALLDIKIALKSLLIWIKAKGRLPANRLYWTAPSKALLQSHPLTR